MGKNYKNWNIGNKVIITHTHGNDLGKEGIITEVRHSFCKINIGINPQNNKPLIVNHCYGQFKKVNDE